MPRVPTYENFQATSNTLPQSYVDAPQTNVDAGRTGKMIGQGLSNLGDGLNRVAMDMAVEANQLRLDDASNQAREVARKLQFDKDSGYINLKGKDALDRPDGQSLTDEYGGKLQESLSQISQSLGNDAQRAAFARFSNGFLTGFKTDVDRHFIQESTTYGLSVAEGAQKGAMDDIALNWNNPAVINDAVTRIQAETYRQAKLQGKSATWQEAQSKALTSSAHKLGLMTALENNDPLYAEAYLKRYASQMNADDILSVKGHITKEVDNRVGMTASAEVISKMQPRIQTSDSERAFNIAINTESNGRQFAANGQPLTSAKGAIGIAQVMPDTAPEAAKLAGLDWDEAKYKNDVNYNKALGLAYFQKQLQDNGGDLSKAYAAYNAGPGALKEATKRADKEGGNWLSYLPKETQNYVAKNMGAFDAGDGKPPRPTFAEIDDALRSDPRIANHPERYKIARADAKARFEEQTQAIKQIDDDAVATAMRGVLQNGGRFSDLPQNVRAAVPPKEIDSVINFAQKISKGDDTTSPWLYSKLANDPMKDPLTGEAMSDVAFFKYRRELSDSDFKHFADERAKRNGNLAGANGPGDLNSTAIKQNIDSNLSQLGINPSPKHSDTAASGRDGAIRKFVNDYFVAAQREAGKKFTDAEVAQHVNSLFLKNQTIKGFISGYSGSMLGMKQSDLPDGTVKEIKAALKAAGNNSPTEGQILEHYWLSQVTKR
jgi:soluble lytic murein transglycosylase